MFPMQKAPLCAIVWVLPQGRISRNEQYEALAVSPDILDSEREFDRKSRIA
jgi:hypothetical protein